MKTTSKSIALCIKLSILPHYIQIIFHVSTFFLEMEVEKRTRGHTLKIHKKGARLDCRRYSFSQIVVNNWNALPVEAVTCTTVNSFKGKISPLIQHIGGSYISHRLSDPASLRPAT